MQATSTDGMTPPARATDSLGCVASKLRQDQELRGGGIAFYRKRVDEPHISQVWTPASDRGFLVGVSMSDGHRRSIFQGRQASRHDFARGAVYVRDFSEDYKADLHGPFDFLLFELPRFFLERMGDGQRGARVNGLKPVAGQHDPVLAHLAHALAPSLARPREASMLFVDQMGTVIATHLLQRYGGAAAMAAEKSRGLSRLHEARAKQMLMDKANGNISIAEIAVECNMSASHFLRAFRATTGHTPHQWLLTQRVLQARELLLRSDLPLAEIAIMCGFSDQSHFSRVFSRLMGTSPGNWRRNA
ncbi:AraC family transcriptional regulator [Herbaspirillum sp. RV1423]|uniref:helix-turn-helix transcriptional regulator n=1 Tax=Herbaspirillum sp. RV1423 TaxID=1443993 RepID=UPI0004B6BACA|nr:AraC family transcriptional regulator [Herbaspirillum sp. RV1423]